MKNWQERLVEGLSGASKAYLKHRRTSKYYYQDKDEPKYLKQSVDSFNKSNIVRSAVPTSKKRNFKRTTDPKYLRKKYDSFGTKYPDYKERNPIT